MGKIERLTNILMQLKKESNVPGFGETERGALAEATCRDIALAQQNLIASGLEAMDLWRLWSLNRKILPDQAAKLRAELPDNHVLQRVLAEHDMILCFIADLDDVTNQVQWLKSATSATMEIRRLAHIAEHLIFAEQHCEREDEVIFPELKRRGYHGLLRIISQQHGQIGQRHQMLKELVWKIDSIDLDDFKDQLTEIANFLTVAMRMHIFVENNIVFPLAVQVISDESSWDRMKSVCDQIGYCAYDAT